MLTLGFVFLVVGILCVILTAVTPTPAPLAQLGWVLLVLGVVLLALGYILPMAAVHTASLLTIR